MLTDARQRRQQLESDGLWARLLAPRVPSYSPWGRIIGWEATGTPYKEYHDRCRLVYGIITGTNY